MFFQKMHQKISLKKSIKNFKEKILLENSLKNKFPRKNLKEKIFKVGFSDDHFLLKTP